jgi:hypothetical protein
MGAFLTEALAVWILLICIIVIIWYRNLGPDRYVTPLLIGNAFLALLIYAFVNGMSLSKTYRLVFTVIGLQIIGVGVGLGLYLHSLLWVGIGLGLGGAILFWCWSITKDRLTGISPAVIVLGVGLLKIVSGMIFNTLCCPEPYLFNTASSLHYSSNRCGIIILLIVSGISVIGLAIWPNLKTCSYLLALIGVSFFLSGAGYRSY